MLYDCEPFWRFASLINFLIFIVVTEGTTTSTTTFPTITPPKILIYIRGPEFQIIETGSTVRYHCSGTSVDNVSKENCEIFKCLKNI